MPASRQFFGSGRAGSLGSIRVPPDVKLAAMKAFQLRDAGFKGGLETGWRRAHQLATKDVIPLEDLQYMRNWYARHVVTSYPGYAAWVAAGSPVHNRSAFHNKHAIIAWLIWGGDPGLRWVNRNVGLLNRVFNKNYRTISHQ